MNYSFLKASILITKILGYAAAALGLISSLIILLGKSHGAGKLAGLAALVMGGVYFLIFYLASDIIRLLLSLHERLERMEAQSQPAKKDIR